MYAVGGTMHDLWHYLTAPTFETPAWGPLSIAFVVLFSLGLIGSVVLYNDVGRVARRRTNRVAAAMIQRLAGFAIPIFLVGLFFFSLRWMGIGALHLADRIWLYLSSLLLAAWGAYAVYSWRAVYPGQLREFQRLQIKKRYLAPSGSAGSTDRKRRQRSRKRSGAPVRRA